MVKMAHIVEYGRDPPELSVADFQPLHLGGTHPARFSVRPRKRRLPTPGQGGPQRLPQPVVQQIGTGPAVDAETQHTFADARFHTGNLSFHFKALTQAGLLTVEQEGRFQRYRANIPMMLDLIAYLTEECCAGHPEQCADLRSVSRCSDAVLPPLASTCAQPEK